MNTLTVSQILPTFQLYKLLGDKDSIERMSTSLKPKFKGNNFTLKYLGISAFDPECAKENWPFRTLERPDSKGKAKF